MNQTSTSVRLKGVFEFLPTLNIFQSITASLGKALILVALHKETSIHLPTKLLFRCLAVTDLCVGVILQPLKANSLMSSGMKWKVIYYVGKLNDASSFILCQIAVFISSVMLNLANVVFSQSHAPCIHY